MAITPGTDVTIQDEPLPRGPIVEPGGGISRQFFNWFQGKDRKLGEIISGVNLNRQNIVQLEVDYQAADGTLSNAYIAADAVVFANSEASNAALSTTLTAAYQSADTALQGQITTNAGNITTAQADITTLFSTTATNGSAISTLQTNLSAEVTNRTNADTNLQGQITTNAGNITTNSANITTLQSASATNTSAIATLQTNLSAETTNRTNADTNLQGQITTNAGAISVAQADITTLQSASTTNTSAIATLQTNLSAEVTNRTNADTNLQGQITTNSGNISTNSANITTLQSTTATNTSAISTLTTNLSAEVTNRTNADTNLQGQITTNSGNISTNSANITTLQSTTATNTSAIATLTTNLSAEVTNRTNADTSLQGQITTNAGNISTNAAAITTEAAARASGDAANASLITALEASVEKSTKQLFTDNFNNDGYYWTTAFGGAPETVADPTNFTYVDVATIGRVAEISTFDRYLQPKAVIKPFVGQKIRMEAKVRATVDPTSGQINIGTFMNGLSSAWVHGAASYSSVAAGSLPLSENGLTVSDGWIVVGRLFTCTAISTYDAAWRPRLDITHTGSGGTVQVAYFKIQDVTETELVSAAVVTEATARASGDAANASLITALEASVEKSTKQLFTDNFNNDGYYWATAFGGAPETVIDPPNFTYVDVATIGRVAEISTFAQYLQPKAVIKPFVGQKIRMEAKVRATVDPTSGQINIGTSINGLSSAWAHGAASSSWVAAGSLPFEENGLTVSDGWIVVGRLFTCTAISTYDAAWRPRLDITHTGSGGTVQVAYFKIQDVTETELVSAAVNNIAEAYATNDSATARLVWKVNTSTNSATIEQTAATGYSDGTWNGSAIKLSANLIELLAEDINFGTNTTYEDTYATLYTTKNNKRLRILGPFPAADDLVLWFGPTTVSLNSETKTNGHFCLATDGKIYLGSAELTNSGNLDFTYTNGFVKTRNGNGTVTTDSVSFTGSGGSGSGYTFAHELIVTYTTGPTVTLSNTTGSPITASATGIVSDEVRFFVQTTMTDSAGNKVTKSKGGGLFWDI